MLKWLLTRNPMALLQLALIALLAGVTVGGAAAWKVQGWRLDALQSKYDSFVGKVKTEGEAAQAAAKLVEEQHKRTVKEINDAWNQQLPKVRDNAVRAYLAHSVPAGSGSSTVPNTSSGSQGADGTGQECLPDTRFIQDAAEDALKVQSWQDWAIKNALPVEP